ncbi:16S rRNA (guanine(966)-N(2))-methyltransferase RsmD [Sulfurovum mangrovi]|uniref:16S rRNA (guanine(966)-N(2))-methyltransferase RsmD n=1 Tax=Sulfurovum mangrovi TaxID=2893889 RepID=UPI001E292609|nr:16S rRNA (guanine(966)-N(2))-methyltransferase RsmD [Sulfurovum mangrovi]UFH58104.1 16S rRNA (guanine(966)-N(2))-methyltransferase RsmD [Sulfurovum mangrovi]
MRKERIKVFTTTINAGKHKGKKLEIPAIDTTRSSKGILKESLFNTLQFDIIDKNFVEVFGGSGSVGLEALSRGASDAYFSEYNKTAYRILENNARNIDPAHTHLFFGDSFEKFETIYDMVKRSGVKSYFYFDPPFSTRDGMDEVYDKTIDLIEMIEPEVCEMVIVEHMSNLDMPEQVGQLTQTKRKKFGRSTLTYYQPTL